MPNAEASAAAGNGGTAGTGATETGVTGNSTAAGATASGSAGTAGRTNVDAGVAGATGSSDAGALGGDAGAVLALEDGQILYVADTLNAGEVDQARAALPKLTNADVRSFANDMITEHGTARDQLLQDHCRRLGSVAHRAHGSALERPRSPGSRARARQRIAVSRAK